MVSALTCLAVHLCATSLSAAAAPPPLTIGPQHELFVDGRGIEKLQDLTRRAIPAGKHPTPVLVADRPWEMQGCVAFPCVHFDAQQKVFRMWYLVYNNWWARNRKLPPPPTTTTSAPTTASKPTTTAATTTTASAPATKSAPASAAAPTSAPDVPAPVRYYQKGTFPNRVGDVPMADSAFICYAQSEDGIKWTKPELGLVEFQGSKKNNIVLRHCGSHFDSFSVLWRPEWKAPEQRYILIAYVGTWPYAAKEIAKRGLKYGVPAAGHYAFFSADGVHWKPKWDKPIAPLSVAQDRTTWSWDARRGLFVGNWKWTDKGKRCRRQSESKDLNAWSNPRMVLFPDAADPKDAQFYGHFTFPYATQYLGWLEVYQTGAGTIDFQLVSSRDGQSWSRVADRGAFVQRGAKGAFDSTMILIPGSPPIVRGNELWVYYEGSALQHEDRGPERAAIGLAKTRLDGFAAVEAGKKSGTLTVKPIVLKGARLFVNAAVDTAAKGSVRVAVTQADGKPLPGFELANALPVTVDSVSSPASWQGDPALPTGKPLRLIFHLQSARLFSYWCQ